MLKIKNRSKTSGFFVKKNLYIRNNSYFATYMIILSILIHCLGNYLPKWILAKNKQNNPFLKLSGLFADFFIAFLLIFLFIYYIPKLIILMLKMQSMAWNLMIL